MHNINPIIYKNALTVPILVKIECKNVCQETKQTIQSTKKHPTVDRMTQT